MVVGVGLWQLKGLAALALAVDMGDEGTGETAIRAAAAEDDPAAVRRPGVVALCIVAVQLFQWPRHALSFLLNILSS